MGEAHLGQCQHRRSANELSPPLDGGPGVAAVLVTSTSSSLEVSGITRTAGTPALQTHLKLSTIREYLRKNLPRHTLMPTQQTATLPVRPSTATDPRARSPGNTNAQSISTVYDACLCDFERARDLGAATSQTGPRRP